MRSSLPLALILTLGLLAACGRSQDSTPSQPPPPADAPAPAAADFSRPLNALGDQPFWALKIRPEGLTFSTTGAKDTMARNDGPRIEGDGATWSATDAGGQTLTATLKAEVCQDPMTGLSYPFTATVAAGGKALRGCAAYADAMPKG